MYACQVTTPTPTTLVYLVPLDVVFALLRLTAAAVLLLPHLKTMGLASVQNLPTSLCLPMELDTVLLVDLTVRSASIKIPARLARVPSPKLLITTACALPDTSLTPKVTVFPALMVARPALLPTTAPAASILCSSKAIAARSHATMATLP